IYNLKFTENIIKEYEKLFPYEYFTSRESIVKKESCSICGEINTIRKHCGHKVGKVYMGEMCSRIVEEFEILGFSIVTNPFDKYTVLFPQDKEYNYFMLEKLMPNLKKPYDNWYVDILKEKNPEYRDIGRNDLCPCSSGIKYKKCCLNSDSGYTDHHRITLLDNPNVKPIPFTLGSTWKN
ncbi:YecA family protein, partial [Paenibacillus odorifer]|uniref:YecA family protein n=3 Tax=Paenibacillus TaxID=44249 RepID=UPI0015C13D02